MDRKYIDWLLNADEKEAQAWAVSCQLDLSSSVQDASGEAQAAVGNQGCGTEVHAEKDDNKAPVSRTAAHSARFQKPIVDENAMDFGPIIANLMRTRPDSCFSHSESEPQELLFHAIALFLLCEVRACERTMTNFLKLYFAEISRPHLIFAGAKEYTKVYGPTIPSDWFTDCLKSQIPLEIILKDLERKRPNHIAVRFYNAYKYMLREQIENLPEEDDVIQMDDGCPDA